MRETVKGKQVRARKRKTQEKERDIEFMINIVIKRKIYLFMMCSEYHHTVMGQLEDELQTFVHVSLYMSICIL